MFDKLENIFLEIVSILFPSKSESSIESGKEPRLIEVIWLFERFIDFNLGNCNPGIINPFPS